MLIVMRGHLLLLLLTRWNRGERALRAQASCQEWT